MAEEGAECFKRLNRCSHDVGGDNPERVFGAVHAFTFASRYVESSQCSTERFGSSGSEVAIQRSPTAVSTLLGHSLRVQSA